MGLPANSAEDRGLEIFFNRVFERQQPRFPMPGFNSRVTIFRGRGPGSPSLKVRSWRARDGVARIAALASLSTGPYLGGPDSKARKSGEVFRGGLSQCGLPVRRESRPAKPAARN